MTDPIVALQQYLRNAGLDLDGEFLRDSIALLTRLLMEAQVSEQIGVDRYERNEQRKTYRNGYRERLWETRVGEIPLRIPKLRRGSYYPSFLEPRRRAERALGHEARLWQQTRDAVGTRGLDCLFERQPGQHSGQSFGEHGLACTGRTYHEHIMADGRSYGQCAFHMHLALHILEVGLKLLKFLYGELR